MTMKKAALGLCTTHVHAEAIVTSLRQVGFQNGDISVLFPDENTTRDFAYEQNTKAPEGAAVDGLLGALLGMGIPEIEARHYENKMKGGSILVSVHVTNGTDLAQARRVLDSHGATHVVTMSEKKAA